MWWLWRQFLLCSFQGFLFALFLVLSLTIAEPLPSMAKEESLSLDLFTTPEVLLRFVCLLFSCNVVRFISKFESFVPHCLSKIKIQGFVSYLWMCAFVQMWPDLIRKAKEGGLDVIQTYVFWNGHEPSPGKVRKILFLIFLCL